MVIFKSQQSVNSWEACSKADDPASARNLGLPTKLYGISLHHCKQVHHIVLLIVTDVTGMTGRLIPNNLTDRLSPLLSSRRTQLPVAWQSSAGLQSVSE